MIKKLLPGLLSLTVLAVLGLVLFDRLQPSLENKEPTFRVVEAIPESEAAEQLPPVADNEAEYPFVNQDRLAKMAGQAYEGPAYAVTPAEIQQMVAEAKQSALTGNRLPANTKGEAVDKKSEPKKK